MMEQELKPYPEYKEIGLPWLKNIPSHWSVIRNKNVLVEQKAIVGEKSNDFKLLSLTKQGVIYRDLENAKGKFPKEFNTYKIVEKDNLIFCLFDLDETPRTVGISSHSGMITGAYDVFKINNVNSHYVFYYYLSIDNIKGLKPLYSGLRKVVKMPVLLSTKLPIPPRIEQDQIVKYLDYKISKINKFIKSKKREIELLKELKQAEINSAVTKGLNPNAPMKDSGIDWFGEIPKHWEVRRLKKCVKLINEKGSPNGGIYIGLENIVSWTGKYIKTSTPDADGISNQFIKNDILYGKLRPYLAKCIIAEFDGICSSELLVLRDFIGVNSYLQMVLISYDLINYINSSTYGAKMPRASWNFIGNCSIPLPPADEQQSIINCLNKKIESLDKLISAIEQKIAFAQEYKTSLISDVVTGKVDVRDVKIEDTFDLEALEEVDIEIEEMIEE